MPTAPLTLRWRNAKHNISASRLHLRRAIVHVIAAETLDAKGAYDLNTHHSNHLRQLLAGLESEYADIVKLYEKSK